VTAALDLSEADRFYCSPVKRSIDMRRILLCIFVSLTMNGCAIVNYYDSHYGKVVDLSTNEPIQGAAVLAVYNTSGLDHTERVDAVEVVTNQEGYFKIPGKLLFTFRILGGWDPLPQIFIYKPGYGCFPKYKKERVIKDVDGTDVRATHAIPDYSLPSGTPLTISLEKLTNEERRQYSDCITNGGVPYEKMRELTKLQYIERINLGFEANQGLFFSNPDLFMAITYDDSEYTKKLIAGGLDVNIGPYTWLMYAAALGRVKIVETLISSGAHIDAQDEFGKTPLTVALTHSRVSTAKLLINNNANVNIAEKWGATPLSIACSNGYFDIVELLLQKGASVSVKGDNGRAVLAITKRVARGKESDRMITLLRSYGAHE